MASSFSTQIPVILHLLSKCNPSSVLDIGKGFGKYGFLIHEYIGIDNTKKINRELLMKELSRIEIDAIEVDEDLMLPHLSHIYRRVIFGDVLKVFREIPRYDLIMMIDVIEHLDKEKALVVLEHFLQSSNYVVVATPVSFFTQKLYESDFEDHISHWKPADFRPICNFDYQIVENGAVYLLSKKHPVSFRGFGRSLVKRARRLARALLSEL